MTTIRKNTIITIDLKEYAHLKAIAAAVNKLVRCKTQASRNRVILEIVALLDGEK